MAAGTADAIHHLADLVPKLLAQEGIADVIARLRGGQSASMDGAWGSSVALTVAALATQASSSLVVVLPREKDLDGFAVDAAAFCLEPPEVFPAWASLPQELSISDPVLGSRLRVVRSLEGDRPPRVVATTIQALLQPVPSRDERSQATRTIKVGDEIDLEELSAWLIGRGFERVTAIELPGEFTIHGGIVDIFSPDSPDPVRLELFGDEIESIRLFDAETQRKVKDLEAVSLTIVTPLGTNSGLHSGEHVLDALPADAWIVFVELADVVREAKEYLERLADRKGLFSIESTLERCTRRPHVSLAPFLAESLAPTCHLRIESIERFGGQRQEALQELTRVIPEDETVVIACHNAAARDRLAELFAEVFGEPVPGFEPPPVAATEAPPEPAVNTAAPPAPTGPPLKRFLRGAKATQSASDAQELLAAKTPTPATPDALSVPPLAPRSLSLVQRLRLCVGHVSRGFRLVTDKLVVLSDNELFGRTELQRAPRRKRLESRVIDSFLDLSEGDLVVHLSHGIARFRGMEVIRKEEHAEEHLKLEFGGGVKIFVPVSLIHLVQKYVGGGKASPELSKVGGTSWAGKKKRVAEAVGDMAADMLKLQAERELKPGLACPPDSHWMEEFEAEFPYTETDDQLRAIADAKGDMQQPRPMDRLICGDVGYGKTEVAMRAAFKAVDAGRQVAILVPTTVLCEQHYRSFSDRMAEFPVTIGSLSRFRSPSETREVLKGLIDGTLDIVIGTHRLISKDVKFKDLGLLVIDEEQRFGVEAKELLKQLRLEVDVLTLSATPIPRTLHMSLVGIRDISNLETPPQDRQAVETRIGRWDGELIRSAVIRELNRDGQIYFVHNRVYNIQIIADKIRALVPEATVDILHGQMDEDAIETAMLGFVRGETDVLVATTIIESGLDIPNANTIFIHQADKYGLSDLHQLRGRVGRYKHRAYCYLLLEDGRTITPQASRRLKAIEEYSELGAGFKIAMRDLEIRGAGNILGTEQSGHIAAVGYELYCQLLENAVRAMKRQPIREHRHVDVTLPVSAYIPSEYVPDGRPKIEMYRKLSGLATLEQLAEMRTEFRDRFGPLPDPVEKLLQLRELQILAIPWQIDSIRIDPDYAIFGYRNPRQIARLAKLSFTPLRIVDDREACLVLPPKLKGTKALLRLLKETLQPRPG